MEALPETLEAEVGIKVGDNITTDGIMPAGSRILPLRSNIEALSEYVFYRIDPDFHTKKGKGNLVVVGGENYGQGSSREHAALAPRYLEVRVKIAKSFARIHKTNLCNFGIIPLTFKNPDDYERMNRGDRVFLHNIRDLIRKKEKDIPVEVNGKRIMATLEVSDRQRKFLLAGGGLNFVRSLINSKEESMKYREEQDTMGTVRVPKAAYYGAETQRAKDNFVISDLRFPHLFYRALGMIKKYGARVHGELGLLEKGIADAILQASNEVIRGTFDDQFVVDVFQTGSGTSTDMNINEIISGRANEMITGKRGGKRPVHPNDHVNKGQSSNDVIPSAIHIAAMMAIEADLIPAMQKLRNALEEKSQEFKEIRKIARTHLQDAVPIGLGQEFSGYAAQVENSILRIKDTEKRLCSLPFGGTAVGTGINAHPGFAERVIDGISRETGYAFKEVTNHFEAQAAKDTTVEVSGALKTYAVGLTKIANDIRWLSSGPICGLGEITLPDLQPGSSIMPGKVNPVIPEVILQVASQVIGNDAAITHGGQAGNFELNVMMPMIAYNLLQSLQLLASSSRRFASHCIKGISANREQCVSNLEKSLSLATAFVPAIGYDASASIAREAHRVGKTVRETAKALGVLPHDRIDQILDEMIGGK